MAELNIISMSVEASGQKLVDDISFSASAGEMVAIIGPNGAGKSSLLRGIIGLGAQISGQATIDGQNVSMMSARGRARRIGWLPQSLPLSWPIRVYDAVALGRFPHGGGGAKVSEADRDAIETALHACGLKELAGRRVTSLSGGEMARVHIARTFACGASIMLVDEPVAALDPRHALAVMALLRRHANDGGTVVVVMHDLGLAARFSDRIMGMRDGKLLFNDLPKNALTSENIAMLFDVDSVVESGSGWPQPVILSAIKTADVQKN